MRNSIANNENRKKVSANLIILGVLVVALLGVIGWLVFDKMRVGSELSNTQQSLSAKESQISSLMAQSSSQAANTSAESVANPAVPASDVYRSIPEWGVRYKVEDIEKDKDVTYALFPRNGGSDLLGVRSVATARAVNNPGVYPGENYPCANPDQSFGHIVRMTTEQYNQASREASAGDAFAGVGDAVKVGDMYYMYRRSQVVSCLQTSPPSNKFKEHTDKWESYGKYMENNVVKKLELIK